MIRQLWSKVPEPVRRFLKPAAKAVVRAVLHPAVLVTLVALLVYAVYLAESPSPGEVEEAVRTSGLQNFLEGGTPRLTLRFESHEPWITKLSGRLQRVILVEGTIAACIDDEDAGLTYCVDVCTSGVLVTRTWFGIKSVAAPPACEESTRADWIRRMTSLLRYALAYVDESRGNASRRYRVGGSYAIISAAPLIAPSMRQLAQELYKDPLAVRSWLLLVIKDQHASWFRAPDSVDEPWAADLGAAAIQFRVGRRGGAAKFGITRFELDDYGENKNEKVTYEVVQVEYDAGSGTWGRPEVVLREHDIPDDLDAVVESGRTFRSKLYIAGIVVAMLLAIFLLRRLYKLLPARKEGSPAPKADSPAKKEDSRMPPPPAAGREAAQKPDDAAAV